MDYKTIVVHLDESGGDAARVACAARIATDCKAHLIGTTQTGISRFIYQTALPGVDLAGLTPLFRQMRDDAEQRGRDFDEAARLAGVASFEHRIGDDEPATALALQAIYADLIVVGHPHVDGKGVPEDATVPQYVAMNSPCPVMVLPEGPGPRNDGQPPPFGRCLVAWNASPESARAVRLALPFLVRAHHVDIAIFDGEKAGQRASPTVDADVGQFLARHGIHAHVAHHQARDDVGAALLDLADERGADLLVMGCYGHSRLREIVLGGVSRTVLRRPTLPTLLAH